MKGILSILIIIIIFVSVIVLLRMFYNKTKEGLKNNKCDSKGCPVAKTQNDIYKTHVEYKQNRDKNHMIAHNTESGNYFSKTKGPSNIFIIRHGEKIKSKDALDCNGILRSSFIPNLIDDLNKRGYGINSIVTTNDYNSMHQQQTVMLTSWLYSIPLFIYGDPNEIKAAVKEVFTNPYYSGKTVLFCWEHNCIQTLLKNIIDIGSKVKGLDNYVFKNSEGTSHLPYWDTNNYKSIYHLDENLNFNVLEERLTTCYSLDNNTLVYGKKQKC